MNLGLISNEELEFVARAICYSRGVEPDCKVTRNMEYRTLDGLIVIPEDRTTFSAWKDYQESALQAIIAVRKFNSIDPRIGDD